MTAATATEFMTVSPGKRVHVFCHSHVLFIFYPSLDVFFFFLRLALPMGTISMISHAIVLYDMPQDRLQQRQPYSSEIQHALQRWGPHVWAAAVSAYVFRLKPQLVAQFAQRWPHLRIPNASQWGIHVLFFFSLFESLDLMRYGCPIVMTQKKRTLIRSHRSGLEQCVHIS
jgi:hypothetical protein